MNDNCECGHPWTDHYDCCYCMADDCGCGPCVLCWEQFSEIPINGGICKNCKELKAAQDVSLLET